MSKSGEVKTSPQVEGSTHGQLTESVGTKKSVAEVARNNVFEILSNHRRRFALHYLHQNNGRVTLGELAEQIAAWENDIEVEEISSDERKRVYTSLQQFHLPKLDDLDFIVFDQRDGTVALSSTADDVDVYMEIVGGRDVPWSYYYMTLAVVNFAIIGAGAFGMTPFSAVPMIGWAVFAVVTFLLSSIMHAYISRTEMRLGDTDKPPEMTT